MKLLATTLLVLIAAIIAAIHLHKQNVHTDTKVVTKGVTDTKDVLTDTKGVHTDTKDVQTDTKGVHTDTKLDIQDIFFYYNGDTPNIEAYTKFLQEVRSRLASGSDVHGIPRTRPPVNIPIQERFLHVQLVNNDNQVITVIIDTIDANVRGYLVDSDDLPTFYYLSDIPSDVVPAFPQTHYTRVPLNFAGNYESLPSRENHQLGHAALNEAITFLFNHRSLAAKKSAILVIIQMLSEAIRIRYVEHVIIQNMRHNQDFIPDPRAITLENSWSDLSQEIQRSGDSGIFTREIQIQDLTYRFIPIRNVEDVMRLAGLSLMLYYCNNPNGKSMLDVGADEQCPISEPTTNIVGRDGQCLEVNDSDYSDGNLVLVGKCEDEKINQLWTFKSDGTIRSNGKCLTTYGSSPRVYTMIYDCETDWPQTTKWIFYDNTIINNVTRLVIAAPVNFNMILLVMGESNNSSMEAWSAGNYTRHHISYISGFSDMCLQANGIDARVWLEKCVTHTEPMQQWTFYGDNTIRLYENRTLCVTSDGYASFSSILLKTCDGSGNQRWTFMADGTILNPKVGLVMDVKNSDVSLQEIILFKRTGNPSQNWLAF